MDAPPPPPPETPAVADQSPESPIAEPIERPWMALARQISERLGAPRTHEFTVALQDMD